jgi:DNA-binding SARP family transcriptional activator
MAVELRSLECLHPREQERAAVYRAYLFGPFRVFRGAELLGQRSQRREKALVLLKWFLLNPGRPRSMDELIDLTCPAIAPDKAVSSFHVAMHCLRRMLEPDLRRGEESSYIRRSGTNFYRFEAGNRWWTDTGEVDRLFEQGRTSDNQGDARRACFYYGQVVAHPVQRFLEDDDSQSHWVAPYRRRYEAQHMQALLRLVQIHGGRGELDESLEYAYQMLMVDPYNELAAITIVDADLECGRPAHARNRLCAFLESLTRDLGVAPSRNLLMLRDRVLSGSTRANGGSRSLVGTRVTSAATAVRTS